MAEMVKADMLNALRDWYKQGSPGKWAFFTELRLGTGYAQYGDSGIKSPEQRIDAWAMCCWPSKRWVKHAFEMKIRRSDFLLEIRNPLKRIQALQHSNQFYFYCLLGIVKPEEMPPDAGLIEYRPRLDSKDMRPTIRIVKEAPWRSTPEPTWRFLASVLRSYDKLLISSEGHGAV